MEQNDTIPHRWLIETKRLIEQRPRNVTYEELAKAAGASLPWVKAFVNGQIKDPSVNKVGAIHDFLSQRVPDQG